MKLSKLAQPEYEEALNIAIDIYARLVAQNPYENPSKSALQAMKAAVVFSDMFRQVYEGKHDS